MEKIWTYNEVSNTEIDEQYNLVKKYADLLFQDIDCLKGQADKNDNGINFYVKYKDVFSHNLLFTINYDMDNNNKSYPVWFQSPSNINFDSRYVNSKEELEKTIIDYIKSDIIKNFLGRIIYANKK